MEYWPRRIVAVPWQTREPSLSKALYNVYIVGCKKDSSFFQAKRNFKVLPFLLSSSKFTTISLFLSPNLLEMPAKKIQLQDLQSAFKPDKSSQIGQFLFYTCAHNQTYNYMPKISSQILLTWEHSRIFNTNCSLTSK